MLMGHADVELSPKARSNSIDHQVANERFQLFLCHWAWMVQANDPGAIHDVVLMVIDSRVFVVY